MEFECAPRLSKVYSQTCLCWLCFVCVCVCVCVVLGLELRVYLESLHYPLSVMNCFQQRVSRTICPSWLQTTILLLPPEQLGLQA
jgi:hypothetical protein